MGTDITVFAEKKSSNGNWELFDDPHEHDESYNYPNTRVIPKTFYDDRNYGLFAILSGCRNGTRSEELFELIDEPRGVPGDMSELAGRIYCEESCHNETWYFVEEVFDFDWSKTIQRVGYVDDQYAHLFAENPLGYPAEEMQRLQNPESKPGDATITVGPASLSKDGMKVRWRQTYREVAGNFLNALERYRNNDEPNSTRIVMWFDS